jgi:hypothetical protein
VTDWLIDKSALWKLLQSPDYEVWLDRINRGTVWASLPSKLEVAVSARDPQRWPTLRHNLLGPILDAAATPVPRRLPWRSWKLSWVPGCTAAYRYLTS